MVYSPRVEQKMDPVDQLGAEVEGVSGRQIFGQRVRLTLDSILGVVPLAKPALLLKTVFWAVSDQALFAVSNFALNVALARWLSANDYGAVAFITSLFLYVITVNSALILEP